MRIKNRIRYMNILYIVFFSFVFNKVKDINYPGYHKVSYYENDNYYNNYSGDRVFEKIPKRRFPKLETNYNNKYIVKVELSNTIIEHSNGFRVYTVN